MKKRKIAFGIFIAVLLLQFISFFIDNPYRFILVVINLSLIALMYFLIRINEKCLSCRSDKRGIIFSALILVFAV